MLGFWSVAIGYALIYTGVEWFTAGKGSLAENLGLPALIGPQKSTSTTAGATSNPAASGLAFWSGGQPSATPPPTPAATTPGTKFV